MQIVFRSAAVFVLMLTATSTSGAQNTPVRKQELEHFAISVRNDHNIPEFQLNHAPEDVWKALPGVYEQLGYPGAPARFPGTSASSREHIFITPYMKIGGSLYDGERNSKYMDCGNSPAGTPAADIYGITFVIVTMVEPHPDGGTRVRVLVDGDARDKVLSNNSVPCRGKGILEAGIAQFLDQRLRQN